MKKIAVLTSGGDSPGLNAAIRGVVRAALSRGLSVNGYLYGYQGLMDGEFREMDSNSVSGIIALGGTVLRSARPPAFREKSGRERAFENLKKEDVEGLIVIGGDGSLSGARNLSQEFGFPVIGIPASIDNDISGTDYSIGFDTAVNTAIEAIDKVRDTAYSHERIFVIEVMGRANGFIALEVALASGAEAVIIPEVPFSLRKICDDLQAGQDRGKKSSIIVVAEGAATAEDIHNYIKKETGFEARYLVLGHMQRGGPPSAFDRVLGARLGVKAVDVAESGDNGKIVVLRGTAIETAELSEAVGTLKTVPAEMYQLAELFFDKN